MSLQVAMILTWLWDWAYVGVHPCFWYQTTPPAVIKGTDEFCFVPITEAFNGVDSERVRAGCSILGGLNGMYHLLRGQISVRGSYYCQVT